MVLRCSGRFSVMVATASVVYSRVSNSGGVGIAAVESSPPEVKSTGRVAVTVSSCVQRGMSVGHGCVGRQPSPPSRALDPSSWPPSSTATPRPAATSATVCGIADRRIPTRSSHRRRTAPHMPQVRCTRWVPSTTSAACWRRQARGRQPSPELVSRAACGRQSCRRHSSPPAPTGQCLVPRHRHRTRLGRTRFYRSRCPASSNASTRCWSRT